MKKTLRKTSAMLCAITVVASSMSLSGFVANAGDEPVTSDYTITIPATLAVANTGWNALEGGISAKGTLESGKKLVITPTSENGWKLVSGENNVGYNLATTGDNTSVYSATAEAPTWEFTELTADGTSQAAGIIVEDYSTKPAGTYQDIVTFTASVEDAAKAYALGGQPINNDTVIKVNFKWRGTYDGDYVQGTYNADSGTFTASKGGNYWGRDGRAVYKFDKNENLITVGAAYYDYSREGMQWTFNTETDTYSYTKGNMIDDMYGLISVTVDGVDVTNKLTKQ